MAWIDGIASVRESARAVIEEIAEVVETELSSHVEVPDRALRLMTEMMGNGVLDPTDLETLQVVFSDLIATYPEVSALQYRSFDGKRRLEVFRDSGGTIRAISPGKVESVPESEWYSRWIDSPLAGVNEHAFWGPAMVRHDLGVPAVTGSRPVVDYENRMIGVMAVEVSLVDVSRFLASLKIGLSGECFVVDG